MPWLWDQSAGEMLKPDGSHLAFGYSGADWGKNNPDAEDVPNVGPIPTGLWNMTQLADSPNTGPDTITLEPCDGTDTEGRSAFRIHGDSVHNPGTASHGCIILDKASRLAIWNSEVHTLEVRA